jgi:hypothetical protein
MNGNMILYFISSELLKLLKYNTNKQLISDFIINFINYCFELFNDDKNMNNIDVKRFWYYINSETFIQILSENSGLKEVNSIYEEYSESNQNLSEEEIDNIIDIEEENDALDMEDANNGDEESGYSNQIESEFQRYLENS